MAGTEIYGERQSHHRRTWSWAALVLTLLFLLVGDAIAIEPAALWGLNLNDDAEPWWEVVYILIVGFGAGVLLLLGWVTLFERRALAQIGLDARGLRHFVKGYGGGLIALTAVVGLIAAVGGYRLEGQGVLSGAAAPEAVLGLAMLLIGFVVQGSAEEIFFRGWLMQLIASRHGLWAGVIVNSAIFSILHAGNMTPSPELTFGLLNIALVGLFLSLYAASEGSIWGVCGWHASWNWLLGLGFGLELSGSQIEATPLIVDLLPSAQAPWWFTGGAFGPEASVITTIALCGGIGFLIRKRAHTKSNVRLSDR